MTRVERNPAFLTELVKEPGVVAYVRATTTAVAVEIRAAAPNNTGYYRRHVKPRGTRVLLEDFAWHMIEYGSVHNPPYAPARRGVLAAGLRLDESRI